MDGDAVYSMQVTIKYPSISRRQDEGRFVLILMPTRALCFRPKLWTEM